jgi:hypothetical protein
MIMALTPSSTEALAVPSTTAKKLTPAEAGADAVMPSDFVRVEGGQPTAKAKYRGLSTAAAKAPPPVEMTSRWGWVEENRQRQKQKRDAGLSTVAGKSAASGRDDRFM